MSLKIQTLYWQKKNRTRQTMLHILYLKKDLLASHPKHIYLYLKDCLNKIGVTAERANICCQGLFPKHDRVKAMKNP